MLDLRDRFFVPDPPAVELRAFTHGLMPKTVPAMTERFVDDWRARGVDAWNAVPNHWRPGSGEAVGWWSLPDYLGDAFIAPMLRAPAGTCIRQPNVHWTVQALLSGPEPFAGGRLHRGRVPVGPALDPAVGRAHRPRPAPRPPRPRRLRGPRRRW